MFFTYIWTNLRQNLAIEPPHCMGDPPALGFTVVSDHLKEEELNSGLQPGTVQFSIPVSFQSPAIQSVRGWVSSVGFTPLLFIGGLMMAHCSVPILEAVALYNTPRYI